MANTTTQLEIKKFQNVVWNFYKEHKRDFPWRKKQTPYHVMVSEIMLQQTQAHRVVDKFNAFIKTFPSIRKLAEASNKEVLQLWQGLGYNRRALFLKRAAESIVILYKGKVPRTVALLEALPGIGPYTARAILAFAHNADEVFIETNIRSVLIHHFFAETQRVVHDDELLTLADHTLPRGKAREWYAALMDYGTYLKKAYPNPSRKSAHHTKQSTFKGSERELRGKILRALLLKSGDVKTLTKTVCDVRTEKVLPKMLKEQLVTELKGVYSII